MTFSYPIPANEADFEEFCLILLSRHWDCSDLERYARRGQSQDGLDIIDLSGRHPLRAAQCKRYDPLLPITVTTILKEVERAKGFTPKIDRFVIMASSKDDKEAQKAVLQINRDHRQQGLFTVQLLLWREIERLLRKYPEVAREVYGDSVPGSLVSRWKANISQVSYLNLPRLSIRAGLQGIRLDTLPNVQFLHEMGWELNRVLVQTAEVIEKIRVEALPITELKRDVSTLVGATVSFSDLFRTKNGPKLYKAFQSRLFVPTGNYRLDPHIYKQDDPVKLVMPISPRWIVSDTAFGQFASGQQRFAGLCTIKHAEESVVIASPLVLGIPKGPWDDFF